MYSYIIEAGTTPGRSDFASFDTGTGNSSFQTSGIPSGIYYLRVLARNASGGRSGPSNEARVTVGPNEAPPTCASVPRAPIGLVSAVNESSVTLSWADPSGECPPISYVIEAGSFSGGSDITTLGTGNAATSYVASGIGPGSYFVRVRGQNANGRSGVSNEVVVVVMARPSTPQFSLTPTRLVFAGNTYRVPVSPQIVTVVNTGGVPVRIFGIDVSVPTLPDGTSTHDSSEFPWTTTCPIGGRLGVGSSCTISIRLVPVFLDVSATATITTNAGTGSVSLAGSLRTRWLGIQPVRTFVFNNTVVGTSAPALRLWLWSSGTLPVRIISISNANQTVFPLSTNCRLDAVLLPNTTCDILVEFAPPSVGTFSGSVTIQADADDFGTVTVPLSGSGIR